MTTAVMKSIKAHLSNGTSNGQSFPVCSVSFIMLKHTKKIYKTYLKYNKN